MLHDPAQSSVYTKKITLVIWLNVHLCKTIEKIHIVQLLFYWQSQFNVMHCSRVSKFCIQFRNSVWNLVKWFSGKSLNLLQPYQMSDIKAKMHQIQCRLGLRPRPRSGSLQRSPGLAGFKEPTSKGGNVWEKKKGGEETESEGRKEKGTAKVGLRPWSKSWQMPWLQNWSDWRGRQHRRTTLQILSHCHCHQHVILCRYTKFYPNRTIGSRVMTS